MLTPEENARLCRVGAETPMGQLLRRYWIPATQSAELEAGGAPKRVRLLGEDLVAFRGTDGRVALLDEACPHRGASLVLARTEGCALRCLYHGWKVSADGTILETPPEPEELGFRHRVRAMSYPTYESGGLVWAFLGTPGGEPRRMNLPFTVADDAYRSIVQVRTECNWVQSIEGAIDSAHSNYLHTSLIKPNAVGSVTTLRESLVYDRPSADGSPRLEVENMPYGFRYAAIRRPLVDPERNSYVRVTLFIAPFMAIIPAPAGWLNVQIFVPMDDEHTMSYFVKIVDKPLDIESEARLNARAGARPGIDLDDEFRKTRNRENNWLQDREAMERDGSSGIFGVHNEDMAVQESMGPLYDRSKEHLGTSDVAIIRMRRLLLDAIARFDTDGTPPPGLADDVDYEHLAAIEGFIPHDSPWQMLYSAPDASFA